MTRSACKGIRAFADPSRCGRMASLKKAVLTTGAVLLLACLAVGLVWRSAPPEPVWQGRTLSAWTDDLATGSSIQICGAAEEAVQAIGTNAIPHLLRMLRENDSILKRTLLWLNRHERFVKFPVIPGHAQHVRAWLAFQALGERAESALPELRRMLLRDPKKEFLPESIAVISPKSVPILLEALPHVPANLRFPFINLALRWPSQEKLVRPIALRCLADPDPAMRIYAAATADRFTSNRSEVISALISALNDAAPNVRGEV